MSEEGMGRPSKITRRDFINGVLVGAGGSLLTGCVSSDAGDASGGTAEAGGRSSTDYNPWTGPGGVGDYAVSNGNTWEVVQAGHQIRDYGPGVAGAVDDGEHYDLVIVGGGFSGVGAAYRFLDETGGRGRCLVLDNHPVFGGEAKENRFEVDGHRLTGPQGSNDFYPLSATSDNPVARMYHAVGMPTEFEYLPIPGEVRDLQVPRDNYFFQLWSDRFPGHGFFFPDGSGGGRWVNDPWSNGLHDTPWSPEERRDLLRWRTVDASGYFPGGDVGAWLDSMTYQAYLTDVLGLGPVVSDYANPVLAAAVGLGADVLSAYAAFQVSMPGFHGLPGASNFSQFLSEPPGSIVHMFPGGNAGLMRYLVKALIPDAIQGGHDMGDVVEGPIDFAALDRPDNAVRIRTGSTVLDVHHEGRGGDGQSLSVTYARDGRLHKLRADAAVMAGGGWSTAQIVRDLPAEYRDAYQAFPRAPMLVVNVALRNWRFMADLGVTACRWFDGFGFSCNIRPPMVVNGRSAPFHPDLPVVLTLYISYSRPGSPIDVQGQVARAELLSLDFASIETRIRRQLTLMFGGAGFDATRDIAGIITNRWGHAYVCPGPGFYFERDGRPAPRDVIRTPFGRVTFANSELGGHQNWTGAISEGMRAVNQVLSG